MPTLIHPVLMRQKNNVDHMLWQFLTGPCGEIMSPAGSRRSMARKDIVNGTAMGRLGVCFPF